MGYVAHDMMIVTTWRRLDECPDIEAFRQTLPPEWRHLVLGPIPSVVNSDSTWIFAPDGSKSGWGTDEQGQQYRERFAALFADLDDYGFDVVRLTYGSDFRGDFDEPRAEYVENGGSTPVVDPPVSENASPELGGPS
jgi:hypothetical protein